MTIFEAIILGIIQGATEFLPVSSSGHSVLLPVIFGLGQATLDMVVVAHLGTLLAVVVYYFKDLVAVARGGIEGIIKREPFGTPESRLAWYIVIATIPAAIIGYLLEPWFEAVFADVRWAAVFLVGTAIILVVGEQLMSGDKAIESMTWKDALIVGGFQVMALLPGISRSGTTIMAGLIRGLDRPTAARFSFLISVPIILGAGIFTLPDLLSVPDLAAQIPVYLATFISAALVGYGCIYFLIAWLRKRNLYPFAIYCAVFGLGYLIYSFVA